MEIVLSLSLELSMKKISNWTARRSGPSISIVGDREDGVRVTTGVTDITMRDGKIVAITSSETFELAR